MLIELPTADEIDEIAITTPRLEVRKIEHDRRESKADLNYAPCKGQVVVVIRGADGIPLVKNRGRRDWSLPSDRIAPNEEIETSAKRVATDQCGLTLRSIELAGIYDVIWHHSDVSIKRLHFVYSAVTDDRSCNPTKGEECLESKFFKVVPDGLQKDEIQRFALTDCSTK
jgi:ADP-ribose pyrophosphatase YjhB (NUDIX family)